MGKVYFGTWHGRKAAFKHISLNTANKILIRRNVEDTAKTLEEFTTQEKLEHENILKVRFCFREQSWGENKTVIVMDRCLGNLHSLPDQDHFQISALLKQIGKALSHIAQNGYSHGDVKPENILITKDGHKWKAFVADFGLVGAAGGTPIFMPPEGLEKRTIEKSDVYSLGILILFFCFDTELATRLLYYPSNPSDLEESKLVDTCPLFKLVLSMIDVSPENRISLEFFDKNLEIIPSKFTTKTITEHFLAENGAILDFSMDLTNTTDMELFVNLDIRKDDMKKG